MSITTLSRSAILPAETSDLAKRLFASPTAHQQLANFSSSSPLTSITQSPNTMLQAQRKAITLQPPQQHPRWLPIQTCVFQPSQFHQPVFLVHQYKSLGQSQIKAMP